MPLLTRLFIKSALVYFVTALLVGLLLAARSVLDLPGALNGLSPVYFHLLMVGWVTQLILGVAHWMFPKFSRDEPRGRELLNWATYWLLNGGLILRVIAEPARAASSAPLWGWLLVLSALLQWLAVMAFIANLWPRVKER